MPAIPTQATRPPPKKPVSASQRRLYFSAHLRFVDHQTSPSTLSSHYRALILDAGEQETVHKIWHFLECMIFTDPKETLRNCLEAPKGEFWDMVIGYTLRGDLPKARRLVSQRLRDTPDWPSRVASIRLRDGDIDPLAALEHVLVLPKREDWNEWQSACSAWAKCEELAGNLPVTTIMGILAGDLNVIIDTDSDWETCFIACVIFRGSVTDAVKDLSDVSLPPPDEILVHAAKGDYEDAVKGMHELFGEFYSAHLCDLLVRGEIIETHIREHYITEYARRLEEMRGFWRVAVDYYATCPLRGVSNIAKLLSRVVVSGSGDVVNEKILRVCEILNIGIDDHCTRVGVLCRHVGNIGGATAWFCRAERDDLVSEIGMDAVGEAEEGAGSVGGTRLAYVVTALSCYGGERIREKLLFVRIYHEMQEALIRMDKGDTDCLKQFYEAVKSLLCGGLPKRFWAVLVYDVGRIVKKYGNMDRELLMEVLSALEMSFEFEGLKRRLGGEVDDVIKDCRKTLLMSLARC